MIKKGEDRERKWAVARANPTDKNRGIEAWRVTSYRYLSIGRALERFLGFIGRSKVPSKAILVTRGNRNAITSNSVPHFFDPKRPQRPPRSLPKQGPSRIKIKKKINRRIYTNFDGLEGRFFVISEATMKHFLNRNRR